MVQYRWKMLAGSSTYDIYPIYKDDMSLNYERETGQQFFRAKLSSKITLVGADANLVIYAAFSTEFIVTIQKSTDQGVTWTDYYKCHFFKTDCTINEDDKKVSVQPTVMDSYEAVLNGMEKEFNLIELAPAIEKVQAAKRPMLQIYADGDSIVSCLFGGNYFETDKVGDGNPGDYGFHDFGKQGELSFTNSSDIGFTTPFSITFSGMEYGDRFYNSDNIYYIEYTEQVNYRRLTIKRIVDDVQLWSFTKEPLGNWPTTLAFEPLVEGLSTITANYQTYKVWARYVLDVSSFDYLGQTITCAEIESGDIVGNNRNYRYMTGYSSIYLKQSGRYSNTPTEWGKNDAGLYFLPPDDEEQWYPVGQSIWVNTSIWMRYDAGMFTFEQAGTKVYTIKDNYPLYSVIKVLLATIAPNVSHDGTAAYSHFFYDDTMSGYTVAGKLNNTRTFLSQKSNILAGEYQEPAKKAPVTLKDVMSMLKNVFGCYWYIDSSNRFCIEHISWFKNGGSYSTSPTVEYDLTTFENFPLGKPWSFGTSEYQYDKEDMPARYQYEWMDKSTDMFNGKPINVLSRFVKEDKVEEITVANFTSDIDYMLLASENCSKDGFALLQAELVSGNWVLPYHTFMREQYEYRLQNYIVAMINLQDWFLTYNMPSWSIEVNDTAVTAKGIQRNKKQTLSFPAGINDPDLQKLVKTAIGNGQYDKLAINLSSRMAKVTLKYNTYDNQ